MIFFYLAGPLDGSEDDVEIITPDGSGLKQGVVSSKAISGNKTYI